MALQDINISEAEIERIITDVINLFLIPKFRELGMPASGEWEQNVHARTNEIWGRDYTEYLVQGRPPNQDQSPERMKAWVGWAGSTILKDWVQAKGLNINPYAVAWKIAREGTEYYPEGTDLLEVLESQEVTDYIAKEIGTLLIAQFQTEFRREFA